MPFFWRPKRNPIEVPEANSKEPICQCSVITPNDKNSGRPSVADVLKFDKDKDVAFCVGIDIILNPEFAHMQAEETIKKDATEMRVALITKLNLKAEKVKISVASNRNHDCTRDGLLKSFSECAQQVEENGNFIFYFAGHGYELKNRCILAPTDFVKSAENNNGISGDDLVQYLNDAHCKASNVLFIFDCCYAGNLGETLMSSTDLTIKAHLFAMSGCATSEKITSVSALGHSIFTFFLLDYLKAFDHSRIFDHRNFKIEQAVDEIAKLCFGLSNLILTYNKETKNFYTGSFNPRLYRRPGKGRICERCDSLLPLPKELHIKTILKSFFENQLLVDRPNSIIQEWFLSSVIQKSLKILSDKASVSKILQTGIASIMLHSSAVLHYMQEDNPAGKTLIGKRSIFLQIAMIMSDELDFRDMLTIDHMKEGLTHYITTVKKLDIGTSDLDNLLAQMNQAQEDSSDEIIPKLARIL